MQPEVAAGMKKMLLGVLGLGVAGALAGSGAAVAHIATVGQRSSAHTPSSAHGQKARGVAGMGDKAMTANGGTKGGVRVYLKDTHGNNTAQVDIVPLRQGGNQVTISAWNLKPGFHPIQLHSNGDCDLGQQPAFAGAGGLLSLAGAKSNPSAAAFPMLSVDAQGKAQTTYVDGNFALSDLSTASGASIVLHTALPASLNAGQAATHLADDSGNRIACGVVFRWHPPKHKPSPSPTSTSTGTGGAPAPSPTPSSAGPSSTPPTEPPPVVTTTTEAGHHW
jgi:Cu/Zn superoxide dismutase